NDVPARASRRGSGESRAAALGGRPSVPSGGRPPDRCETTHRRRGGTAPLAHRARTGNQTAPTPRRAAPRGVRRRREPLLRELRVPGGAPGPDVPSLARGPGPDALLRVAQGPPPAPPAPRPAGTLGAERAGTSLRTPGALRHLSGRE